ncbi:hypothetical protein TI04_06250 [Achromatium sp. WMS2]|nr:hypothetical protein TI04_06250 [Achromatium sp. WMS2]
MPETADWGRGNRMPPFSVRLLVVLWILWLCFMLPAIWINLPQQGALVVTPLSMFILILLQYLVVGIVNPFKLGPFAKRVLYLTRILRYKRNNR